MATAEPFAESSERDRSVDLSQSALRALVIDDDLDFRSSLELLVQREGFAVRGVGTLRDAQAVLSDGAPDVVLVDLKLPDGEGISLLQEEDLQRQTEFVVITGHASVDSAVNVLRSGAVDYLTKPVDRARLKAILSNVARTRALKEEVSTLRGELRELGRFGSLVGRSKAMQDIYQLIERVAPTDATVLISGESGTGKELVAETVHRLSPRRKQPFLPLNCGAVSPNLIESELFGHEKGSFTGADRTRKGYFERCHGGTLFLDEITEMPFELQVKLLRVLETGSLMRVGGTERIGVDVRVLAATNRSPEQALADGKLREDLFYRLNVFPIALPPLRIREGDIEQLAEHFLEERNAKMGTAKRFTRATLARLCEHSWPGNVRELKNTIHRTYILADDEIDPDDVFEAEHIEVPTHARRTIRVEVGSSIAEMEKRLILATLREFESDKKRAAEALGFSLKTLYNRLNVYKASNGGE